MAATPLLIEEDVYAHHGRQLLRNFHRKFERGTDTTTLPPPIPQSSALRQSGLVNEEMPVGILGAGLFMQCFRSSELT
jgi:hypothetical protein